MRSQLKAVSIAPVIAAVLLCAWPLAAQPAVGTRIAVAVRVAGSPAAQIEECERLRASIYQLEDEAARVQRVLEVIANLDVVRQRWPKATDAIIEAAFLQADVALEFNMPRNAADALAAAVPAAANTERDAWVQFRLGAAREAAGQLADAEKHFLAAETSPRFKKLDRIDANEALQTIGMFYVRQNKPREAMKRFRLAAELPNQTPEHAALHRLSALREAVRLKDDDSKAEAKRDAKALREALHAARANAHTAKRPAESQSIAAIERDLERIAIQFGL